jgi:hypothetical protein
VKVQRAIEGALSAAGAQTAKQLAASTGLPYAAVRHWLWRALPAGRVRTAPCPPQQGWVGQSECRYTLRDPTARQDLVPGAEGEERQLATLLGDPAGLLQSALASRTALEVSWVRSTGAPCAMTGEPT